MRARSCGEIGRRAGFRFQWATVWVQVPSTAPNTEILLGVFYFEVVIELIDEQPDIYGYTMEMVFVGCYMDYELTPIINFVNIKVD